MKRLVLTVGQIHEWACSKTFGTDVDGVWTNVRVEGLSAALSKRISACLQEVNDIDAEIHEESQSCYSEEWDPLNLRLEEEE